MLFKGGLEMSNKKLTRPRLVNKRGIEEKAAAYVQSTQPMHPLEIFPPADMLMQVEKIGPGMVRPKPSKKLRLKRKLHNLRRKIRRQRLLGLM